ncbi:MAG: ABC transporter ATP-binding protein [Candidatus Velamenicoccus archaeovorus]
MSGTEPPAGAATHAEQNGPDRVVLDVEGLVVRYPIARGLIGTLARRPRQEVHAVEGISFTLRRGEMLALVGESGCGKTTTAQAVLRLVDAQAGAIRLEGRDISAVPRDQLRELRRRVQIIYQDPYESLDPRFTVRDTIEEPMRIHRIASSPGERAAKVGAALARVGLQPPELFLDRYPHELSGGQRQRVAVAASLVLDPELLVADEPVSMLDVSVRAGVLSLLDELRRGGVTILMITHDLSTAAHYADRIAVMYLGTIVEEGPALDVVNDPQHPYTKALMSVIPDPDPRRKRERQILRGETPNPVNVPPGCRFHPRCPVARAECRTDEPRLHPVAGARSARQRAACLFA